MDRPFQRDVATCKCIVGSFILIFFFFSRSIRSFGKEDETLE